MPVIEHLNDFPSELWEKIFSYRIDPRHARVSKAAKEGIKDACQNWINVISDSESMKNRAKNLWSSDSLSSAEKIKFFVQSLDKDCRPFFPSIKNLPSFTLREIEDKIDIILGIQNKALVELFSAAQKFADEKMDETAKAAFQQLKKELQSLSPTSLREKLPSMLFRNHPSMLSRLGKYYVQEPLYSSPEVANLMHEMKTSFEHHRIRMFELEQNKGWDSIWSHRGNTIRQWMEKHSEILSKVEQLNLNYKELLTLPPEIKYFTGLKQLRLFGCKLYSLCPEIKHLQFLEYLELEQNLLQSLPDEIGFLAKLKCLSLKNNKLERIPRTIGDLSCLENLLLNGNLLTTIPEELGNLFSLQELFLYHNNLSALPKTFSKLQNLKKLTLMCNKFQEFPTEILNLKSLTNLDPEQKIPTNTSEQTEWIELSDLKRLALESKPSLFFKEQRLRTFFDEFYLDPERAGDLSAEQTQQSSTSSPVIKTKALSSEDNEESIMDTELERKPFQSVDSYSFFNTALFRNLEFLVNFDRVSNPEIPLDYIDIQRKWNKIITKNEIRHHLRNLQSTLAEKKNLYQVCLTKLTSKVFQKKDEAQTLWENIDNLTNLAILISGDCTPIDYSELTLKGIKTFDFSEFHLNNSDQRKNVLSALPIDLKSLKIDSKDAIPFFTRRHFRLEKLDLNELAISLEELKKLLIKVKERGELVLSKPQFSSEEFLTKAEGILTKEKKLSFHLNLSSSFDESVLKKTNYPLRNVKIFKGKNMVFPKPQNHYSSI